MEKVQNQRGYNNKIGTIFKKTVFSIYIFAEHYSITNFSIHLHKLEDVY